MGHTSIFYAVQPSLRTVVVASNPVQMGVSCFPSNSYGTEWCPQSPVSDAIWPRHLWDQQSEPGLACLLQPSTWSLNEAKQTSEPFSHDPHVFLTWAGVGERLLVLLVPRDHWREGLGETKQPVLGFRPAPSVASPQELSF